MAACAREWGHAVDRSDFEVLQRAVLPAFAPLLRKHPSDPKCKTTELCFLLRAGWVVVGPLRGRGCSWCAPAGGARAKCGPWGGLHRDFWGHPSHLCPYSSRFFSFSLLLSTSGRALVMLGPGAAHGFPPSSGACHLPSRGTGYTASGAASYPVYDELERGEDSMEWAPGTVAVAEACVVDGNTEGGADAPDLEATPDEESLEETQPVLEESDSDEESLDRGDAARAGGIGVGRGVPRRKFRESSFLV